MQCKIYSTKNKTVDLPSIHRCLKRFTLNFDKIKLCLCKNSCQNRYASQISQISQTLGAPRARLCRWGGLCGILSRAINWNVLTVTSASAIKFLFSQPPTVRSFGHHWNGSISFSKELLGGFNPNQPISKICLPVKMGSSHLPPIFRRWKLKKNIWVATTYSEAIDIFWNFDNLGIWAPFSWLLGATSETHRKKHKKKTVLVWFFHHFFPGEMLEKSQEQKWQTWLYIYRIRIFGASWSLESLFHDARATLATRMVAQIGQFWWSGVHLYSGCVYTI